MHSTSVVCLSIAFPLTTTNGAVVDGTGIDFVVCTEVCEVNVRKGKRTTVYF